MSSGFVTASGKGVLVSKESLEKAKKLFDCIDDEFKYAAESSSSSSDPPGPFRSSELTPKRPRIQQLRQFKRNTSTFNSPVIKKWSLKNDENELGEEFASPAGKSSCATPTRTLVTNSNSACSDIGNIASQVTPIKLLTPYCKNWRLCLKITNVDEIRTVRNSLVFSFLGVDDEGIEIRVSAYDEFAKKIASTVNIGQMYYISNAAVNMISKRYSRSQHDMELVLRKGSEIRECTDRADIAIPEIEFKFVQLQSLQCHIGAEIDVLGIVVFIGDATELYSKTGEKQLKRNVQIVGDDGYSANITLWGQRAKAFPDSQLENPIAAKGVFVRQYNGAITLVPVISSKMLHNPDLPEAALLLDWYNENRKNISFKVAHAPQDMPFSEHKWIGRAVDVGTFTVTAMISNINTDNAVYKGCINESCKKKLLLEKESDNYVCPKCSVISTEYKYYYTFQLEIFDFTGTHWVTIFDGPATELLGEDADEVAKYQKYDHEKFEKAFKITLFKTYMLRINSRKRETGRTSYAAIPLSNNSRESCSPAVTTQQRGSRSFLHEQGKSPRGNIRDTDHSRDYNWTVLSAAPVSFESYISHLQAAIDAFESHSTT